MKVMNLHAIRLGAARLRLEAAVSRLDLVKNGCSVAIDLLQHTGEGTPAGIARARCLVLEALTLLRDEQKKIKKMLEE